MGTKSQLLFFDTFTHEVVEELNLDLVQFPSPVIVEEVRVIPLGARVQANFPGGMSMRLGATNPKRFTLEFFVNDLTKPGVSTFESLGVLAYEHTGQIQLNTTSNRIPTDGLVLRGFYNAITLAVYGTFSNSTAEQLAAMGANKEVEVPPNDHAKTAQMAPREPEWTHYNQPALAWPPPEQAPRVRNNSVETAAHRESLNQQQHHHHHHHQSDWRQENGQRPRDGSYDHHKTRRPSGHDRSRSPPRDYRSRTKSPVIVPLTRRSLTPKSPTNNGHISPPHPERKRSPAPPLFKEEPAILDDVSDISDGDIPDDVGGGVDDDDDDVVVNANKDNNDEVDSGSLEREPSQGMDEEDAAVNSNSSKQNELVAIAEDVEEISDEEAEWSDDGYCVFTTTMDDLDMEFGADWDDPVKEFDLKNQPLLPLSHFRLFSLRSEDSCSQSDELVSKLAELNRQDTVTSEWVEVIEAITNSLEATNVTKAVLMTSFRRGLSLEQALKQPVHTYKVRHLKSSLSFTTSALQLNVDWTHNEFIELFERFLGLLEEKTMAVSLQLKVLEAVHRSLDHRTGMKAFLRGSMCGVLVEMIAQGNQSTRLKSALAGIVERVSLNEAMELLQRCEQGGASEEVVAVVQQLTAQVQKDDTPQLLSFLSNEKCGQICYILRDMYNQRMLSTLWQCISFSKAGSGTNIGLLCTATENLLMELLRTRNGLLLMSSFPQECSDILDVLKNHKSEVSDHLNYSLHALALIDQLTSMCSGEQPRATLESMTVLSTIQTLYGMTFSAAGRSALVNVLARSDFLRPIITLACHSVDSSVDDASGEDQQLLPKKDMKKSAVRGYACEILLLVVRTSDEIEYLYSFSQGLLAIGKSDESSKLYELTAWLGFLEDKTEEVWTGDHPPKVRVESLEFFCDIVKKNLDNISPMSSELVLAIRFLKKVVCTETMSNSRFAVILAYARDLVDHYLAILNKICGYHEQPHLHTATFAGFNGYMLLDVVNPITQVLRRILGLVIGSLDDGFKDTTAIGSLLKTFTLCTVVSTNSACHSTSLTIRSDIIQLLLSFTSVSVDMSKGTKTTWQVMVNEVVKYVLSSPYTYMSGLKVLSELLPLPLPIREKRMFGAPNDYHQGAQRNLWSAQLYSMEAELRDMILVLMPCKVTQVKALLTRVCIQMADLSAPIATIVAQAISDNLTSHLALTVDLLHVPSIKTSFLDMLRDNSDYLKTQPTDALCQLAQPLLNHNVSLTPDSDNMANSLPEQETCVLLLNSMFESSSKLHVSAEVAATLCTVSQHEYGLSLLRASLLRKKTTFRLFLEHLPVVERTLLCGVLIKLQKYVSHDEMCEVIGWPQVDGEAGHCLVEEEVGAEKLLDYLRNPGDYKSKPEDLEVQLPSPEGLLDQFSKRTTMVEVGDDYDEARMFRWLPATHIVAHPQEAAVDAVDLVDVIEVYLPKDVDVPRLVKQVCDEKSLESDRLKKKAAKKSLLEAKALANKNIISSFKAGGHVSIRGGRRVFHRGPGGQRPDAFRSRPPNTSRPPSLHVDDFIVLQSRGQQPTGPTGYNKQSVKAAQELFAEKEAKSKGSIVGFREATKEPVYDKNSSSNPPQVVSGGAGGVKGRGVERTGGSGNPGKGYRGGRTFNRDRHGSTSVNSGGGRGWSPSAGREYGRDGRSSGGPSAPDRRFATPRRNLGDSRRGSKDRSKLKGREDSRPRNMRSAPR